MNGSIFEQLKSLYEYEVNEYLLKNFIANIFYSSCCLCVLSYLLGCIFLGEDFILFIALVDFRF